MDKELNWGPMPLHCPVCEQRYAWMKHNFTRPDGYPNWELRVYCHCGEQHEHGLQALARECYDWELGEHYHNQQVLALAERGLDGQLALPYEKPMEHLCGD